MKHIKKIIAVVLSVIMTAACLSVMAFAKTSEEADTHLQFNEDGSFKIMQVSDTQDGYPMKSITKKLLRKAIDTQNPDLIVLTGDNITSGTVTKLEAKLSINEFMSIFEEYGIPVVMTFGNHDDETTAATKEYQLSCYEKYSCFIGCAGEDLGDTNLCTYYVPIYSSTDKNNMIFNIWMVDSGNYNSENDLSGYACVTKAQIDWYTATSEKLESENGRKIPSLMFQHIVVPEVYDYLKEVPEGTEGAIQHDGSYYVLPDGAVGEMDESPCPPKYTNGQFAAVLARGDVLGMYFGHDHVNTYSFDADGVTLSTTPGAGFNSYNNENVGVRVFTLSESNPWSYEDKVLSYYDLFDYNNDADRYDFKRFSDTSSSATKFACLFKYLVAFLKQLVKLNPISSAC